MATRTLNVKIAGDPSSLGVAARKSEKYMDSVEKRGHKMGKTLALGFAAAGAAASGALVVGLKKSVDAAKDAEASMAKVKTIVDNAGISFDKHAKQIDKVIQAHSRLTGFDDEELAESFANMVRTTGDLNKAFKLNALAADIARAKGTDLAGAQSLLARVYNGSYNGVKRLGIAIEPVTKAQDKLKESNQKATVEQIKAAKAADKQATSQAAIAKLQKAFGGQAEAYGKTAAGAQERFSVALENVQEKLGAKLLPIFATVANAAAKFLDQIDRGVGVGGRFAEIAGRIGSSLGTVAGTIVAFGERVRDTFSGGDESATGSFSKFASNAREAIRLVVGAVTEIGQKVAAVFSDSGIGANLAIIGRAFLKLESAVSTVVLFIAKHTIPIIVKVIEGLATTIKGVVAVIAGILSGDFSKAWEGVKTVVRGAVKAIVAIVEGLAGLLWDGAKLAGETVGKGILKGLANLGHLLWEKIKDAFGFLTDPQRVAAAAADVGEAIGKGVLKGLDGLGHLLLNKAKDALTFVADNLPGPAGVLGKVIKKATGDGVGKTLGSPLPSGTFGGSLMGARPSMAPFASAASRFGLGVTSGRRPGAITSSGNQSYHSSGEAIDVAGSSAGMLGFFRQMKSKFGSRLAELIYTPGGKGVKDGRPFTYGGQVAADHYDHVHVAYDTGAPGVGDGIGQIKSLWTRAGGSSSAQNMAAAIAMAESGGNPTITHRNSDGSIDRGLWQINSVHGALSTTDRLGNAKAAVSISSNGRNWNPWTVFKTGAYKRFLSGAAKADGGSGGKSRKTYKKNQTASGGGIGAYDPTATYASENAAAENLPDPITGMRGGAAGFAQRQQQGPPGRPLKGGGPTKGYPIGYTPPDVPSAPTADDYALARVARARLTEGTDDDISALEGLLGIRKGQMDAALADSDPRNDADAIDAYLAVKESLDSLKDTIAAETAAREEQRKSFERLIAEDYRTRYNVSQSQYGVLAQAVADASNRGIGQLLGLSLSGLRAAPGAVARV